MICTGMAMITEWALGCSCSLGPRPGCQSHRGLYLMVRSDCYSGPPLCAWQVGKVFRGPELTNIYYIVHTPGRMRKRCIVPVILVRRGSGTSTLPLDSQLSSTSVPVNH